MVAGMGAAAIGMATSDKIAASEDTAASVAARLGDIFPMENAEDNLSKFFALEHLLSADGITSQ